MQGFFVSWFRITLCTHVPFSRSLMHTHIHTYHATVADFPCWLLNPFQFLCKVPEPRLGGHHIWCEYPHTVQLGMGVFLSGNTPPHHLVLLKLPHRKVKNKRVISLRANSRKSGSRNTVKYNLHFPLPSSSQAYDDKENAQRALKSLRMRSSAQTLKWRRSRSSIKPLQWRSRWIWFVSAWMSEFTWRWGMTESWGAGCMYVEDLGTGEFLIWVCSWCRVVFSKFLLHIVGIRPASKYGFRWRGRDSDNDWDGWRDIWGDIQGGWG